MRMTGPQPWIAVSQITSCSMKVRHVPRGVGGAVVGVVAATAASSEEPLAALDGDRRVLLVLTATRDMMTGI